MIIEKDVSLKPYSHYGTGGRTRYLLQPSSLAELQEARAFITKYKLPFFILGKGSNSLVSDKDWNGAVVVFSKLDKIRKQTDTKVYVEAGCDNSKVSQFCLEEGLGDASWLNGLPGQLGGTVRMNARCYGGEISQIVSQVSWVDDKADLQVDRNSPSKRHLFRAYKDTIFMDNGGLIGTCILKLRKMNPKILAEQMTRYFKHRESAGQFDFPSCGCVFKNDYSIGVPSGQLLEQAGAKELSLSSRVKINPHHANFVYNLGGASADEIYQMTVKMHSLVKVKFGYELKYEMEFLGNWDHKKCQR